MSYLEEAATQLRLALAQAEKSNAGYPDLLASKRREIAAEFAYLAAIDRGLVPAELVGEFIARATAQAANR